MADVGFEASDLKRFKGMQSELSKLTRMYAYHAIVWRSFDRNHRAGPLSATAGTFPRVASGADDRVTEAAVRLAASPAASDPGGRPPVRLA